MPPLWMEGWMLLNKTTQMREQLAGTPQIWHPEEVAALASLFGVTIGYTQLVVRGSSRSIRVDVERPHICFLINPAFTCTKPNP